MLFRSAPNLVCNCYKTLENITKIAKSIVSGSCFVAISARMSTHWEAGVLRFLARHLSSEVLGPSKPQTPESPKRFSGDLKNEMFIYQTSNERRTIPNSCTNVGLMFG